LNGSDDRNRSLQESIVASRPTDQFNATVDHLNQLPQPPNGIVKGEKNAKLAAVLNQQGHSCDTLLLQQQPTSSHHINEDEKFTRAWGFISIT